MLLIAKTVALWVAMCSAERIVDMLPLVKELFMPSLNLEYPRKGAVMLNVLAAVAYVFAITSANAQEGTLIAAALRGDLPRVRVLLDAKADLNARNSDGATALIVASQAGHADVVRALLAAKADVNAKASNGATALTEASLHGQGWAEPNLVSKRSLSLRMRGGDQRHFSDNPYFVHSSRWLNDFRMTNYRARTRMCHIETRDSIELKWKCARCSLVFCSSFPRQHSSQTGNPVRVSFTEW
jgi:hypothetical protein